MKASENLPPFTIGGAEQPIASRGTLLASLSVAMELVDGRPDGTKSLAARDARFDGPSLRKTRISKHFQR